MRHFMGRDRPRLVAKKGKLGRTVTMDEKFQQFAENIWVAARPLRFFGIEIGTRMTVIRLADGSLFLHSPVALDAETLMQVQALGPVSAIVAPNRLHHLFLGDYCKVFPKAKVYAAPGLETKRKDLPFTGVLQEHPEPAWLGQIDQQLVPDLPIIHEVDFFHRVSRTLLLTDLAFNLGTGYPYWTRLVSRLFRIDNQFGPTPDLKYFIKRRPRAQVAIQKMLAWDFDRIILAHGNLIARDGKAWFKKAFGPLL